MKELSPPTWTRILRIVGILIVVAIAGNILWSIITETLLPLLAEGDARKLSVNLFGVHLIVMGTMSLVMGGVLFVNRTAVAFADGTFHERATFAKTDPRPQARREVLMLNLRMLGRLWQPALILLAMAFVLIIVGGRMINM